MNSFYYSFSNCMSLLLQRSYDNMVRKIHIEHISNLNTKSCNLFHLDSFCCPPFIESPSNRTSCANNIVFDCKLLGDIFCSNIFMKLLASKVSSVLLLAIEHCGTCTRRVCTRLSGAYSTRLSVSLLGVLNATALLRLSRMNNEYI
jgi:hypothetical protein